MDLISREKALADDGLAEFHRYDDYSKMREYLKSLPSAFEGMTNGEVFQAIFPCDEVHINGLQEGYVHFSMKSNLDSMDCFSLGWWNTTYKAESIDPNDMTHIFDGVTEIPKDVFKGWYTEELLEQIRAKSEVKPNE